MRPDVMNDRLARFWAHKHWKVRHGMLQFMAEAVCMLGDAALATRDDARGVLTQIVRLVEDPERCARPVSRGSSLRRPAASGRMSLPHALLLLPCGAPALALPLRAQCITSPPASAVRDAAIECLEEVYQVVGEALIDAVSHHGLRPAQLREVYSRLGQAARAAEVPLSTASAAGGGTGAGECRDTATSRVDTDRPAGRHADADKAAGKAAASPGQPSPSPRGGGGGAPRASPRPQPPSPPAARPAASPRASTTSPQPSPRAQAAAAPPARARPAAAAAAPPAARPAARRGGYKDGGGVGVSGELPDAPAIVVACERELASEMDKIAAALEGGTAAADWQKRIAALVALEGLVKGGAAGFEGAFDDGLKALREAIGEQLLDRRSSVSRQACHALAVLSRALGPRFDGFAAAMVPLLFKVRGRGGGGGGGRGGEADDCCRCKCQPRPCCLPVAAPTRPRPPPASPLPCPPPGAGYHGAGRRRRRRRVCARAGAQPPRRQAPVGRVRRADGRQERQAAAELQSLPARGGTGGGRRGRGRLEWRARSGRSHGCSWCGVGHR
jgi:hypothetical protein